MSKTKSFLFTAALALATAFTLSCSSDNGGGGGDIQSGGSSSSIGESVSSSSDEGLGASSSSSDGGSSSSENAAASSSSEAPHSHIWGEWETAASATCAAEGMETRVCADDPSHTETRSIAQLAWGEWATTTPATCEAEGEQTRTCPGNASPAETRSVAQLDWGEWAITAPATCEAAGVERRTCPGNASPAETRYITTASPLPERRHYEKDKEQFCDARDGKAYVYVEIGTQTWMAENLNYAVEGSKCYDNLESNCDTYGRLYNWATAINLPSSCNTSNSCSDQIGAKHQGICPQGWHIPSDAEWTALTGYVGANAGTKLKAASGWSNGNSTDDYGFSALPGGFLLSTSFSLVGSNAYWWSSTDPRALYAYLRNMSGSSVYRETGGKISLYSVRCLKD